MADSERAERKHKSKKDSKKSKDQVEKDDTNPSETSKKRKRAEEFPDRTNNAPEESMKKNRKSKSRIAADEAPDTNLTELSAKKRQTDKKGEAAADAEPQAVSIAEPMQVDEAQKMDEGENQKKSKKKRRKENGVEDVVEAAPEVLEPETTPAAVEPTQTKKRKKNKKSTTFGEQASAQNGHEQNGDLEQSQSQRKDRFIVFVGNLPYTTTTSALEKHFAKISPTQIRHRTEKGDKNRSKGFAFLEFDRYDRMKTCLSLYHHTTFEDGTSPGRKINVELTAGGGGTNADRKAKLKAKNDKLAEERKRKFSDKAKKDAEKAANGSAQEEAQPNDEHAGMHPSRRAQLD